MKICFFHLKAHAVFDSKSDAPIGGTLVQMRIIAKKLAEDSSLSVSFLTGDFGQADGEIYDGITVYKSAQLKRQLWYYIVAPFKIWSVLKKIDADVYITSSAGTEIGLVALFCKLYKKKMIYRTAHEWDCNGEYARKRGFSGKCFAYGLRNAHAIVTQSEEHQKLLRKNFDLDAEVIKNSYSIQKNKNSLNKEYILWVSRCEVWKNPDIFIELAGKCPEYSFVMICPIQKHQEDFFEATKKQAREKKNLKFIDFVPFEDIQEYFDRALVFVGTSEYEGFPNTFLQSCMARTPIISYKVNPDDFINKNNLGYCVLGDRGKLESHLKKLLGDKKEWMKKSENAFKYIEKNHDINVNIEAWLRIIQV